MEVDQDTKVFALLMWMHTESVSLYMFQSVNPGAVVTNQRTVPHANEPPELKQSPILLNQKSQQCIFSILELLMF